MNGLHHLNIRRRASGRAVEPFPSENASKRAFDKFMFFIGMIYPFAYLPQVLEVYTTHQVSAFALSTWLLLGVVNLLWTAYGIIHRAYPVLVANALTALFNFAVVAAIVIYH